MKTDIILAIPESRINLNPGYFKRNVTRHWKLDIGISLEFGIWDLDIGISSRPDVRS